MGTILTIVLTAAVTAVGTLFVERRRKAVEKVDQREAAAAKLLRALVDCEAYVNGGPGMPNETHVWESQREVRDAAMAYGDASRAWRRSAIIRRPSADRIAKVQQAALAVFQAEWDNFDHADIGTLAKRAVAALVREHPDLAAEADEGAIERMVRGREEPRALPEPRDPSPT